MNINSLQMNHRPHSGNTGLEQKHIRGSTYIKINKAHTVKSSKTYRDNMHPKCFSSRPISLHVFAQNNTQRVGLGFVMHCPLGYILLKFGINDPIL
jgi:hypothetical protein